MKIGLYVNIIMAAFIVVISLISGCNPSPDASVDRSGKIFFQDDFSNPNSGWYVYKANDTKGGNYDNGAYKVWSAIGKNTVIVLNPKTRQEIGDFAVEANVRKTSEECCSLLGIIYRAVGTFYYRFTITDNQTFWVSKRINNMEVEIYEDEFSSFIKPSSEINKLKVVCKGDKQEFYVNDNMLATISDNTSLKGELGMAFSNYVTPNASFTFSDFKLWNDQ